MVDTSQVVAALPATAIGINAAVWDGHLRDAAVPALLRGVGVALLRYPGGAVADAYHWETNLFTPGDGGDALPTNGFDNFMTGVVRQSGARALITVNYGSNAAGTGGGDPAEAAGWVRYANVTKGYGVTYWEIGNEVYGNGYYGVRWETDMHPNHSPAAYARNALTYIATMKRVDPSIQVGLDVMTPGDWMDRARVGDENWNRTVLSIAGPAADFVSVHWYPQQPGAETDAGLLASPSRIPAMVARLRALIARYCGARASRIGIMVTESNSVTNTPGKQTTGVVNGLFLLRDYLAWLQAGARNVTWWNLHNGAQRAGANNGARLTGATTYGDYGLLASGGTNEPAADTPFPSFAALRLLGGALLPGSLFIRSVSLLPAVTVHALRQPGERLAIILINTSASAGYMIVPRVDGMVASSGSVTTFGPVESGGMPRSLPLRDGSVTYHLAPYTAAVLEFRTR